MANFEEIKENPVKYLKSLAMDLVVVVVSLAYIFYQLIDLEKTELNPIILIAEAIIGIICGIVIKQALGENGFGKGYNSQTWIEEEEKYNRSCAEANKYMERVSNYNAVLEKEKRTRYRTVHLQAVRLKYSDWFDEEGDYIGSDEAYKKLDRKQRRMLNKCVKVRIYVLNMFSEYSNASEQDTKPEPTDKRQRQKNMSRNTISATVVAIIGVYFVPVLNGWNWANLIASTMQVALWVLFGVLQLYQNFNFVVQDKVSTLRKKKEMIGRFVKECDMGLHQTVVMEKAGEPEPVKRDEVVVNNQVGGYYVTEVRG